MHAVQSASRLGQRVLRHASNLAFKDRALVVRVTNGTGEVVTLAQEPYEAKGSCNVSFAELLPGEVGTIRFSSKTVASKVSIAGVHHAAALELVVGGERLVISESCPLGQSRRKNNRFYFAFGPGENGSLASRTSQIPQGFMGLHGRCGTAKGKDFLARANATSMTEVDLVIQSEDVSVVESWDSATQLRFAELCRERDPQTLVPALFVLDALAAISALKDARLTDRAFVLDSLVTVFVKSGVLRLEAEGLRKNLARWEEARVDIPLDSFGRPDYDTYNKHDQDELGLAEHVEASLLVVRAAVFQCIGAVHGAAKRFRAEGLWADDGDDDAEEDSESDSDSSTSTALPLPLERNSTQEIALAEHLGVRRRSSEDEDGGSSEEEEPSAGGMGQLFSCMLCCSKSEVPHEGLGTHRTDLLITLVHKCMQTSAHFVEQRASLYDFAAKAVVLGSAGQALLELGRCLPAAQRVLHARGTDFTTAEIRTFSQDALANLDDGVVVGPKELMDSFGDQAPRCKPLSTNSKSGEFFFMSADRKFCVKTISEDESVLMRQMLPRIGHHIRKLPQSLIVRFAGLFHLAVPKVGLSQNFVVMRSVFDTGTEIHETFDLKGSLHNRKKKEGESIGKDEDWITAEHLMKLTDKHCRELLAVHELDAELLQEFEVMDYSLLVGLHRIPENQRAFVQHSPGHWKPSCGILSADCSTVYYAGLIDFLIGYDLRKEAEHLIRVVQGVGASASCVSPEDYARRQARFLRDRVVADCGAAGQLGRLKIEVQGARNLSAGDWGGSSDPYVRISLGLLSVKTVTVVRELNPTWNCTLYLPVNEVHSTRSIDISVWDEDMEAVTGSDDFLGKLVLPLSQVLAGPVAFRDQPLSEVTQGLLSLTLQFEAC